MSEPLRLTVFECDVLLEWYAVAAEYGGLIVEIQDEAMHLRLREWRRREMESA